MPLPSVVFLGAADYEIVEKKNIDVLGETDDNNTTIRIKRAQSDACKRDTLLHEVLHAVMWLSGGKHVFGLDHEDEEKLIRVLTPWILAFLRDNPESLEYLLEK